jgi:SAM-dependent methyltransferase
LKPFAEPKSWLDIGTGHGHFPHAAKEVFPDTAFDGLDLSEGVELAHERGWVGIGYRGPFIELAQDLGESYDAVSMFHYLEHTPEPRKQLAAAHSVIRSGGHLVIEVPDPESRWGRILGRWWMPWLQPQHLNFIPIANLRTALTELGFTVLLEQHAEAHGGYDLISSLLLALHDKTRSGEDVPWQPASASKGRQNMRSTVFKAGGVFFLLTVLLDKALKGIAGKRGFANAYRVVARKD